MPLFSVSKNSAFIIFDTLGDSQLCISSTNQIKDLGCHLKNVSEFVKPFSSAFLGAPRQNKSFVGKKENLMV